DYRQEKLRIGCQIEQTIAGQILFTFQIVQPRSQSLHALGSSKIGVLGKHVFEEIRGLMRGIFRAELPETHLNVAAKYLIGLIAPSNADDGKVIRQVSVLQEAGQGRKQFAAGKIPGRPEQDKGERLRRLRS